jgi:hypothetical protein
MWLTVAATRTPRAVLIAGLRGGEALAEGLFGEMNAWGRLPYLLTLALLCHC